MSRILRTLPGLRRRFLSPFTGIRRHRQGEDRGSGPAEVQTRSLFPFRSLFSILTLKVAPLWVAKTHPTRRTPLGIDDFPRLRVGLQWSARKHRLLDACARCSLRTRGDDLDRVSGKPAVFATGNWPDSLTADPPLFRPISTSRTRSDDAVPSSTGHVCHGDKHSPLRSWKNGRHRGPFVPSVSFRYPQPWKRPPATNPS
jgi:hypothetical protein